MAVKTITIRDEAYRMLAENKRENESFSEEIIRLLSEKRRKRLGDFAGVLTEKEGEKIIIDMDKIREANIRMVKERLI